MLSLRDHTTSCLHPCLRNPGPAADCARAVCGPRGSLITYLENTGFWVRGSTSSTACGSRARRWIAWPKRAPGSSQPFEQSETQERDCAVCDLRKAGVRLGLGCDNCSGSDVQSMFQAMKMFCLLAAVSEPEPGPGLAHEVLRHATLGNARTAGLEGELGAIRPGYKADLILIDLNDVAYLPFNSAARQLVYTEAGRGVESVWSMAAS